jgi:sortase (surface protein transpeptidase)
VSFRSLRSSLVAVVVLGLALAGPGTASGARLVIPKLGLNVAVANELNSGPTVYFRDANTIGVAGHRTTYTRPFNQLPRLHRGDMIRYAGKRYRVRRTAIIRPWEVWVLRYKGIVLSACHPAGSAAYRFVVIAAPV